MIVRRASDRIFLSKYPYDWTKVVGSMEVRKKYTAVSPKQRKNAKLPGPNHLSILLTSS